MCALRSPVTLTDYLKNRSTPKVRTVLLFHDTKVFVANQFIMKEESKVPEIYPVVGTHNKTGCCFCPIYF